MIRKEVSATCISKAKINGTDHLVVGKSNGMLSIFELDAGRAISKVWYETQLPERDIVQLSTWVEGEALLIMTLNNIYFLKLTNVPQFNMDKLELEINKPNIDLVEFCLNPALDVLFVCNDDKSLYIIDLESKIVLYNIDISVKIGLSSIVNSSDCSLDVIAADYSGIIFSVQQTENDFSVQEQFIVSQQLSASNGVNSPFINKIMILPSDDLCCALGDGSVLIITLDGFLELYRFTAHNTSVSNIFSVLQAKNKIYLLSSGNTLEFKLFVLDFQNKKYTVKTHSTLQAKAKVNDLLCIKKGENLVAFVATTMVNIETHQIKVKLFCFEES